MEENLTVEAILDLRVDPNAEPIRAEGYLKAFSEAEWTDFREHATRGRRSAKPVLKCADCKKAVYGREHPVTGRRHCVHFAGDHSDCIWAGAIGGTIKSVDAAKFHGQQEGEEHKALSNVVAEILALDTDCRTAGISFRRYTKAADGQYVYPDVFARQWRGNPAAFEIQLSTTHLPVITGRQDFYEKAKIRLVWLIGYHTERLGRRAFRDIYIRNDGQILGVDGEVLAAARAAAEPRFRLYRLLPGSPKEGFAPRFRHKIVAPDDIAWGGPGSRPSSAGPSYDAYLDQIIVKNSVLSSGREHFYEALRRGSVDDARTAWNSVAAVVGGQHWDDLPSPWDSLRAMGVLATVRTGALWVKTDIAVADTVQLVNSMLLEPSERRCWTHAFRLMCRSLGRSELLAVPSIASKCRRNIHESDRSAISVDRAAGAIFNAFFPEGAFYRFSFGD
ncbi:MAG TPA: DUF6035 family protein [Stellaceae bacterium]|jgi:hypothetical protein|nr:DUF6035 family protein [Stellaceae bacterium]